MEHALPGEVVARYSGEVLTKRQLQSVDSAYVLEVHSNCFLDAAAPDNMEGRFINDGPHSGRQPNCAFSSAYVTNPVDGSSRRWVKVFATRRIRPGEELLTSYGPEYWNSHARPPGRHAKQYYATAVAHNVDAPAQPAAEEAQTQTIKPAPSAILEVMDLVNEQLPDGVLYAGREAHEHVLSCDFYFSDECRHTYITTAALRRSGCHPKNPTSPLEATTREGSAGDTTHDLDSDLMRWLCEGADPRSALHHGERLTLDQIVVLLPQTRRFHLSMVPVTVVASKSMRCVIGTDLRDRINLYQEDDESPLQSKSRERCEQEIAEALERLVVKVDAQRELTTTLKAQVGHLLRIDCARLWRAKFDLQQACFLPEMKILLQPGATPTRIKRRYRWSEAQDAFLEKHLADLVDAGVISHIETEWLCPIVLVEKTDDTWRLCVDPSTLNSVTIPMTWQMPEVRRLLQARLSGCSWFAKFDFVAMFWQIGLHPDSRKLFSFFAGRFGSFCFNRVAMGALNSSNYTQKMLARMFENVMFNGKPMMENGLFVQTDDVLLYADSPVTLLELIVLFLRTVMIHNLAIHPDKCVVFAREVIYCGLKVSGQGVAVDPERLAGLKAMPAPTTVGDVWRFKASVGWIRPEIPLLAVAEDVLNTFITTALKSAKKRDMRAADKITLGSAGWARQHRDAWDLINTALEETITKSFRNRRWVACIFTDASETGWAICITQCELGELDKPWDQQRHQLLAVSSGMFRSSQRQKLDHVMQRGVSYCPSVRKHRHLLLGDHPFVSINDHESLKHVFTGPLRAESVGKPAQGRLARWAAFLRSYVFQTRHIPGACNMFCDLMSRNGCASALTLYRKLHSELVHTEAGAAGRVGKQFAIIMPTGLPAAPPGGVKRSRDLNVFDNRLLPAVGSGTWPTPEAIAACQQTVRLRSPHWLDVKGHFLLTNASGRVMIPAPQEGAGGMLDVLIVVAHQGDHYHRSSGDTAKQFMHKFAIHGFSDAATKNYITRRCRGCLSCIKLRTGDSIPRPLWFLVRATVPFEYLHLDFLEMPVAATGEQWILVVVDDLSLTTLLHPCKRCTAEEVVKALLNEWLAHYPDPVMLHTDGGRHFDNAVVRGIARACGWRHTISTAYSKWTHGVSENANRVVLDVFKPLLRALRREVNQWPGVVKLVQKTLQRKKRKSRGDKAPIELTTSIVPEGATDLLVNEGLDIRRVDGAASEQLDTAATDLAAILENHWDLANTARRAKSQQNMARTDMTALPEIDIGDYVLYAVHVPDTKLDYRWKGPGQVIHQVTPMVFIVEPVGIPHVRPFPVHVQRLRRFAAAGLEITEQLQLDVQRDHPGNVVQKVVGHQVHDGRLWCRVRWLGFSAARDSWQLASALNRTTPAVLLTYYRRRRTRRTPELLTFMRTNFPSADIEARLMDPAAQPRHFARRPKCRARELPTIAPPVVTPATTSTEAQPRITPATFATTVEVDPAVTRARRGGRGRGRGRRGRGRGGRGRGRRTRGVRPIITTATFASGNELDPAVKHARTRSRRGRSRGAHSYGGRGRGARPAASHGQAQRSRGRPRKSTHIESATRRSRRRSTSADSARTSAGIAAARLPHAAPERTLSAGARRRGHVKVSNAGARVTYDSWLARQNADRDSRRRARATRRAANEETLAQEHRRVTDELAMAAKATSAAAALAREGTRPGTAPSRRASMRTTAGQRPVTRPATRSTMATSATTAEVDPAVTRARKGGRGRSRGRRGRGRGGAAERN